jgi:hypothetical protein
LKRKEAKRKPKKMKRNSEKKCLFLFILLRSEKRFLMQKLIEYEAKKYLKAKKLAKN